MVGEAMSGEREGEQRSLEFRIKPLAGAWIYIKALLLYTEECIVLYIVYSFIFFYPLHAQLHWRIDANFIILFFPTSSNFLQKKKNSYLRKQSSINHSYQYSWCPRSCWVDHSKSINPLPVWFLFTMTPIQKYNHGGNDVTSILAATCWLAQTWWL